jgi:hypothetical protein
MRSFRKEKKSERESERERVTEREKWNRRGNSRRCKMLWHEIKEIQFGKGLAESQNYTADT